jgi:hypothetical protein
VYSYTWRTYSCSIYYTLQLTSCTGTRPTGPGSKITYIFNSKNSYKLVHICVHVLITTPECLVFVLVLVLIGWGAYAYILKY